MPSIEVRTFTRADRDQVAELVNAHVEAVLPGVSVPVNAILSQFEREPAEYVVDPWAVQRATLIAVVRDRVVAAAHLVRRAVADAGLAGGVKTSGSKGVHVVVPIRDADPVDAAAATRALAARAARLDPQVATTAYIKEDRHGLVFVDSTRSGTATIVAAYSPRVRPGLPVSTPVDWGDLAGTDPRLSTVRTAAELLGSGDPWAAALPAPQRLPADLVAEGHTIPVARVAAMHEGRRRARAQRAAGNE